MRGHLGISPGIIRGTFGTCLRAVLASGVLCAMMLTVADVRAEMRVKLKDGRVLTLPVDPEDVESVTFPGKPGAATGILKYQPIRRAADQIKDDEKSVQTSRDAERRALAAAKAAEEAAKTAADAAATAKREAAAATKARAQAESAARVAPKGVAPPQARPASPVVRRPLPKRPSGAARRGAMVLKVGPGQKYDVPSKAARAARDGDTVEIAAGIYVGDVAEWNADNLIIRGVGGRAHMNAKGKSLGGKATWVIVGDNAVVENVEFSNSRVADRNGAGIRLEGRSLTVRNGYFHNNQMGILTGSKKDSDIVIEGSEFARNIVDYKKTGSLGHNIYVGRVRSFVLRNSYVHGAAWGHNIKTRAAETRLLYNRIVDGRDGSSSYLIDIANGGRAWLVGNVIQQGKNADNWAIVSFGAERRAASDQLAMINNTIVNDRGNGVFLQNRSPGSATLINNIFAGPGTLVKGPASLRNNLIVKNVSAGLVGSIIGSAKAGPASGDLAGNFTARSAAFVDPGKMNFALTEKSPARNIGAEPGLVNGWPARPSAHYRHPRRQAPRPNDGKIDIGAFEYAAPKPKR